MIRFKTYLKELLDSPQPYSIKINNESFVEYSFTIDDNFITVTIFKGGNKSDIQFSVNDSYYKSKDFSTSQTLKLFSTIKSIIKEYISNFNPKRFFFTTSSNNISKVKLYDKLSNMFNWSVHKFSDSSITAWEITKLP